MDYTKEMIAFMDWLEINHMDPTAQTLWFHLMAIWYKSGCPEWFTVTNHTLEAKLGGKTKATLTKARNVLVQKGRVEYRGKEKVRGGSYHLIPLSSQSGIKNNPESIPESSPESIPVSIPESSPDSIPEKFLLKDGKKEGKIDRLIDSRAREEETSWQTMQRLFQEIFGEPMAPNHYSIVNTYLDDGMELEVIVSALEDAKTNNAEVPKYLWRTIGSWFTSGVRTVADYCRMIENHVTNPQSGNGSSKRSNVVPLVTPSSHAQSLQEKFANRGKKTSG